MRRDERELFDRMVQKDSGWVRLEHSGILNRSLRDFMVGRSGAYAFRLRDSGKVLYVGESHTDRLWKTMLRHTQAPDSFEARGEWAVRTARSKLELRAWIADADDALALEAALIQMLEPEANEVGHEDDWKAVVEDDEIPF